jgi:myo-inositol-1-phosphate synthase
MALTRSASSITQGLLGLEVHPMAKRVRVAVAGVGNNISALVQGIYYYSSKNAAGDAVLPGLSRPSIGGYSVHDIDFVAAFDINRQKIGKPLNEAIFVSPNNYPKLDVEVPVLDTVVQAGPILDGAPSHLAESFTAHNEHVSEAAITGVLRQSRADVLLYSLPTGAQNAADFYARCALNARTGFVNCTPEIVARNPELLAAFREAGLPVLGDDLASHMGSSIVHKTLLKLFLDRGIDIEHSYQLNIGGNMDFKNLTRQGSSKAKSKKNALADVIADVSKVEIIPSGGYIQGLGDRKVAVIRIDGLGWGGAKVALDVTLTVQDSSNAAGVIIDLLRLAALARDAGVGGFVGGAGYLLKSPPDAAAPRSTEKLTESINALIACAQANAHRAG